MKNSLKSNDEAVAISLDFILSFTIAIFVFVIIFSAVAGYLTNSNEFIMREKFKDIGNEISTKMVNIYNIGGKSGYAYTWVKLPNDVNGLPFDVRIIGNGSDGDPVRIVVTAQRLNAETYVTVNELGDNVYVESNVLTSGNIYTIIYDNLNIYFYQGLFDVNKTPSPYIIYPQEGSWVKKEFDVQVRSDPDTSRIDFYRNVSTWGLFGTDTIKSDGWKYPFNTTFPLLLDGTKIQFRVNATDRIGKIGTSPVVNVTVDNTPPVVKALTPVNGSIIYSSRPYINASYSDTTSGINVASVKMYLNGFQVSPQNVNATNVSYRPPSYLYGNYTVKVTVEDNAGNLNSTSWNFTVMTKKKNLELIRGYDSSGSGLRNLTVSKLLYPDYSNSPPNNTYFEAYTVVDFPSLADPSKNHTYYFNKSGLIGTEVIRSVNISFKEYSKVFNISAYLYLYDNRTNDPPFGAQSFIWMDTDKGNMSYWNFTDVTRGQLDNLRMIFFANKNKKDAQSEVKVDYVNVAFEYYDD